MPPNAYPLILVTNDDGISSPGLVAAAEAMLPLAEVFVVAPDRQWSGAGRSMPDGPQGRVLPYDMWINEQPVAAYQVDGSPALVVLHALLELVPRQPDLVVSGINYDDLLLTSRVNGQVTQQQRTSGMVFNCSQIVSFTSRHVTLEPGDLIFTGTMGKTPAIKPGDLLEVEIEHVGVLKNPVVAEK